MSSLSMMRRAWLAAAMLAGCLSPAGAADNNFPTPGGSTVPGSLQMCLNGLALAVQCPGGIESAKATYKYSSLGNTPAATPTDLFTIAGSATKTIRITKLIIGGVAGTAGQLSPLLVRRSAANTGGTSTAPAIQKRDTTDGAASATIALYTVNPASLGTAVGTMDTCRLLLNLATAAPDVCQFSFGTNNDKEIVLRGATDILAINFAGAAVPATGLVDLDIEWTEE